MRKRVLLVMVSIFFCTVFASSKVEAGVDFKVLQSAHKRVETKKAPEPFFKSLDPRSSSRGAVKTFVVRKATMEVAGIKMAPVADLSRLADVRRTGSLLFPVKGEVSSLFGVRANPFVRRVKEFHTGIDIRAKTGTPIFPAMNGKVVFAGWKRGYGLTVEVEHANGLHTMYAHCSRISTNVGASVSVGHSIAAVGRTGITTGSHLHFEVLRGKVLENPLRYLR